MLASIRTRALACMCMRLHRSVHVLAVEGPPTFPLALFPDEFLPSRDDGGAGHMLHAGTCASMGVEGTRPCPCIVRRRYRAEMNKLTNIWCELDREGLGANREATLDDVLLSDAFDRCLNVARKGGAVGSLEPTFHNYMQEVPVLTM